MAELELTGALEGLKKLASDDLPRYKRAICDGGQMGLAYYFPYLLAYNRRDRSAALITEDDGSVCIFRWRAGDGTSKPRLDLLVAPTPINTNVLRRCLERANTYNRDQSARILRVDAQDMQAVKSLPSVKIRAAKPQYLYSPESFTDISGRSFRSMRRNVSKVKALANLEVLPYSRDHKHGCLKLLKKWKHQHQNAHGTIGGVGTTKKMIDLAGTFADPEISGEIIMLDENLVGFAFGGEIRPGFGAFMEAKCDFEIQGLSYFQRYSFMSKLNQFDTINDGCDVGREGLRQLKTRLRPAGMHEVYKGVQQPA